MLTIRVLDRPAELQVTKWEGVERRRSAQWCTLEIDGLPTSFQITTDPGMEYAPGLYDIDPKSFSVQRGRLTIERLVIRPVAAAAKAVARSA